MTSLLLPILSTSQCASCKFCCSFAEFEEWEAPLFSEEKVAALTPTCIEMNKLPIEDIRYFVDTCKIIQVIADEAKKIPEMIKEYREDFPLLGEY